MYANSLGLAVGQTLLLEELNKESCAFVLQHATCYFDAVGQRRFPDDVNNGTHRPHLLLKGTEDEGGDPCREDCSRAHRARFEGDDQFGAFQDVVAPRASRHPDRLHLRVGCGIHRVRALISPPADNLAACIEDCGGDGDIGKRRGQQVKYRAHPLLAPLFWKIAKHHNP